MKKFDRVIQELEARGLSPRIDVSARVDTIDALVGRVAILSRYDLQKIRKLEGAGYKVAVVPEGRLSDEEIKGFCDEVEELAK